MNGSWTFEDASLSAEEKELLFRKLNGKISDEEYNKAFTAAAADGQQ